MPPAGKTVREIRHSLGIPDTVDLREGGYVETKADPVQQALDKVALADAKRLESAAVERLTLDAEAGAEESALKLTKLKMEARLLQEQIADLDRAKSGGSEEANLLRHVLANMEGNQKTLQEQYAALLAQIMENLRAESDRLQAQLLARAAHPEPSAPPRRSLAEEIQEVKATYETLFGPPQTGVNAQASQLATSIDDIIKLHNVQEAHEIRMEDIRATRAEREQRMRLAEEREEEDRRRGSTVTKAIERGLPALLAVGDRLVSGQGAAGPAAPAAAPSPPIGSKMDICPGCKSLLTFPPGHDVIQCGNCGVQLQWTEPSERVAQAAEPTPVAAAPAEEPTQQAMSMSAE